MAGKTCSTASDYFGILQKLIDRIDCQAVDAFAEMVFQAWRLDRLVLVFGNGGSASTASHWVADLVKTAAVDGQRRLRAICLTDNVSLMTAIGNDIGYDHTLDYPLQSYGRPGDVAVAISGSGNSPNVVKACEWARDNDLRVVSISGFNGGRIGHLGDIHINIPSDNFGHVEDLHLSLGHTISQSLKARVTEESRFPARTASPSHMARGAAESVKA